MLGDACVRLCVFVDWGGGKAGELADCGGPR
jgi:hypothetical protein